MFVCYTNFLILYFFFFSSKKIYTPIFRSWNFSRKLNYFLRIRILFTVQKIFRFLDINVFFFFKFFIFIFLSTISIRIFFSWFCTSFHWRISKYLKIETSLQFIAIIPLYRCFSFLTKHFKINYLQNPIFINIKYLS